METDHENADDMLDPSWEPAQLAREYEKTADDNDSKPAKPYVYTYYYYYC